MQTIHVRDLQIGPGLPLVFIAGPCVIETRALVMSEAEHIRRIADELKVPIIFKASYLKDNRSSIKSPRGPGIEEGLRVLADVRDQYNMPITTDVHDTEQAHSAGDVVDLLQIPAFLCRQTSLLLAAAATGKPINVKKGQFVSPTEMKSVIHKLVTANASGIMLTERGTFFGYQRLVNDFIGLADMADLGWPVCFDATHSTQQPGSLGDLSGGRPERAPVLARAAVAAGVQALFFESHPDCQNALCDAATMLPLDQLKPVLKQLTELHDFLLDQKELAH
ncbi:3-deoxy-8-phosphooctulonate synthase [candidate division KSB1 bacterium]|nr:3-deoxy-8-phosphooctulonate synthase [candidate division KSB1 bacterium]RQV99820.1 MAG: 3-deoxy-8-phosphooctulonate synthase [candidate division KSB1 bacterium]